MFAEWALRGKPSMLGTASGVVAGLVVITPGAGLIGPMGAIVPAAIGGVACLWGVSGLKNALGYDESLDVFGIHGIGGIIGAIGTGVFVSTARGGVGVDDYSTAKQVFTQTKGVIITILWSGVVSLVAIKLIGGDDLWIACHALMLDATLVTNNLGEFERTEGLRLEDWVEPNAPYDSGSPEE